MTYGTLAALLASLAQYEVAIATVMFALCTLGLVVHSCHLGLAQPAIAIVLGALLLRAAVAVADWKFKFLPYSLYDAVRFEALGWEIASAWRSGRTALIQASSEVSSYAHWIAILQYFFGRSTLLLRMVNATLGALTVVNVYRIARLVFSDPRAPKRAALLAAVFPSATMFSAVPLREALVILLISAYVLYTLLWIRTFRLPWLIVALSFSVLAGLLRPENLPIYWIALLPSLISYLGRTVRSSIVGLVLVAVLIAVALLLLFAALQTPSFSILKQADVAWLGNLRARRARGEAVYLAGSGYSSLGELLGLLPLGTLHFLLAPFPWQASTPIELLASLDGLLVLCILLLALAGLRDLWARERGLALFLMVFLAVGVGVYGIVDANAGAALRHRAQFTWLFAALAGASLTALRW